MRLIRNAAKKDVSVQVKLDGFTAAGVRLCVEFAYCRAVDLADAVIETLAVADLWVNSIWRANIAFAVYSCPA